MNFIESIFDSFQIGIKQSTGEYPNEIKDFIIGSGSNFTIHRHITQNMADRLYKNYKSHLPLGKKISSNDCGSFKLEDWHTMESNTGHTYTFMFEVNECIEHNPNDVITEWIENDKKHKGFMADLLKIFTEEKNEKTTSKQNKRSSIQSKTKNSL